MTGTGQAGWTPGQRQALHELRLIAEGSPGLSIIRCAGPDDDAVIVEISLDCGDIRSASGGVRLRPRERLQIVVPRDFPFEIPKVRTRHRRWAGTPHVQFGRTLCLYRSPAVEWDPSDGMFGFLERLLTWLERAAAGQLDPTGQPLHPPVAYALGGGTLVVRADAPRAAGNCWLGLALLHQVTDRRADVVGWLPLDLPWPMTAPQAHAAARAAGAAVDRDATIICAAAVLLTSEIGFEFPLTTSALATALRSQGVPKALILGLLGLVARVNRLLTGRSEGPDAPLYTLIGTPSRGIAGSHERITHLVAWQLPNDVTPLLIDLSTSTQPGREDLAQAGAQVQHEADQWLSTARISWATVYENRPEIITRRDATTPTGWLRNRRILVLGAGALGAPIAEACVRAGAAEITIVDFGTVHPGILVRQPYDDADIGQPKATALAERLQRIGTDTVVIPCVADVKTSILHHDVAPPSVDLVVDATADRVVRALLERRRASARHAWPAVATLMVGHDAARGVAVVSLPGASGGPADILRRLGMTARRDNRLADVAQDFFPDPPRTDLFQPEPGCSDVTFTGGACEVTGLAGQLCHGVLSMLVQHSTSKDVNPMAALVIRTPPLPPPAAVPSAGHEPVWLTWRNDTIVPDASGRYEIRIAASAVAEMRAEARRGVRVRNRQVETGGLLIGGFDDAAGALWIDHATGPPPDSRLSPAHFQHGTQGVDSLLANWRSATARISRFVGMWHTHPDGPAAPSPTDEAGMTDLLVPVADAPRRALLLIVGAPAPQWSSWLTSHSPPHWYAQVIDRTHPPVDRQGTTTPKSHPPDSKQWWPGGYGTPPSDNPRTHQPKRPWWRAWSRKRAPHRQR